MTTTAPPVPEVLAVTELSFTALLQQHTVWRSWSNHGDLTTHYLADMDRQHLLNVRAQLGRMAPELHHLHLDQLTRAWRVGTLTDEEFWAQHGAARLTGPQEWLDAQPLVIQIDQLLREPAPARGLLRMWRR